MPPESLLDYFHPAARPAREMAVVWRKSYRRERWSWEKLGAAAAGLALEMRARGISKGDRVLLWGENGGEWIAAFLACLLSGAIVVPLDAIGEKGFAERVSRRAQVRLAIVWGEHRRDVPVAQAISFDEVPRLAAGRSALDFAPVPAARDDPVEIVFTSGTTAEPRGVVITHGNILANLSPIEREFQHYRRYERFVHPLGILNLVPLSHVFGQLLGIFLPQVFGATIAFMDSLNPAEVIREIRAERISALVAVPRLAESLEGQLERDLAASGQTAEFRARFARAEGDHFLVRWWRFRQIRRRFGWQFWALVSGGAALASESETFWTRLGYAVIQGYGLTETTSLVSLNHPFRPGRGSIGKPVEGHQVKLSPQGEILVRGENIAPGYWGEQGIVPAVDSEGWFHTGDLGERDAAGNLYFKGRSKSVIVTPEGLKIYPSDLEAELRKEPGVRDSVVVGLRWGENAEPCAVLLLHERGEPESGERSAAIVEAANRRLAPFQRMRRSMVWPEQDFPRTATHKPMLGRIREVAEAKLAGRQAPGAAGQPDLVARFGLGDGPLSLSSVERVELLGELEDRYQVDLGETDFASADMAAIEKLLASPPPAPRFRYPTWPQSWPARIFRALVFRLVAIPVMLILGWPRIEGRKRLAAALGPRPEPSLVVSNHVVYLDPAYVLLGLPGAMRRRLAVAMDGELLESFRRPPAATGWLRAAASKIRYLALLAVFNVFPLPRRAGFQRSFAFIGSLVDRGWHVLIFPEGELTKDGRTAPFRAGIGLLVERLAVPVVPVHLAGLWELKKAGKSWARPYKISVKMGEPGRFRSGESPESITRQLEQQVQALGPESIERQQAKRPSR